MRFLKCLKLKRKKRYLPNADLFFLKKEEKQTNNQTNQKKQPQKNLCTHWSGTFSFVV